MAWIDEQSATKQRNREITVQVRDNRKPLLILEFKSSGSPSRFEYELDDIKKELRERFEASLKKLFG